MFDVSDDELEEIYRAAKAMLIALNAIKTLADSGADWNGSISDHAERAIRQAHDAGINAWDQE